VSRDPGRLAGAAPRLEQLTHDHSLLQAYLDRGGDPESRDAPQANIIQRSMGSAGRAGVAEVVPVKWVPGDVFLLCSDGLWGAIHPAVIEAILVEVAAGRGTADPAEALVQCALAAGHRHQDNLAAVVVRL
jgi:serine/threonine protein phosphatase PrpC